MYFQTFNGVSVVLVKGTFKKLLLNLYELIHILYLLPPFKGTIRRWLDHVAGIYLLEDVLKHVCDHAGQKGIEKELIAQVCYKIFFRVRN